MTDPREVRQALRGHDVRTQAERAEWTPDHWRRRNVGDERADLRGDVEAALRKHKPVRRGLRGLLARIRMPGWLRGILGRGVERVPIDQGHGPSSGGPERPGGLGR